MQDKLRVILIYFKVVLVAFEEFPDSKAYTKCKFFLLSEANLAAIKLSLKLYFNCCGKLD